MDGYDGCLLRTAQTSKTYRIPNHDLVFIGNRHRGRASANSKTNQSAILLP